MVPESDAVIISAGRQNERGGTKFVDGDLCFWAAQLSPCDDRIWIIDRWIVHPQFKALTSDEGSFARGNHLDITPLRQIVGSARRLVIGQQDRLDEGGTRAKLGSFQTDTRERGGVGFPGFGKALAR